MFSSTSYLASHIHNFVHNLINEKFNIYKKKISLKYFHSLKELYI